MKKSFFLTFLFSLCLFGFHFAFGNSAEAINRFSARSFLSGEQAQSLYSVSASSKNMNPLDMQVISTHTFAMSLSQLMLQPENEVDREIQAAFLEIIKTPRGQNVVSVLKGMDIRNINFLIHSVSNQNRVVYSWSEFRSGNLNIHLFVNTVEATKKSLLILIAHELGQISSSFDFSNVSKILIESFARAPRIRIDVARLEADSRFRILISTFRAYAFEQSIAQSLNIQHDSLDLSESACVNTLKRLAFTLSQMPDIPLESQYKSVLYPDYEIFLDALSDNFYGKNFCQKIRNLQFDEKTCRIPGGGPRPGTLGDP